MKQQPVWADAQAEMGTGEVKGGPLWGDADDRGLEIYKPLTRQDTPYQGVREDCGVQKHWRYAMEEGMEEKPPWT